MFLIIQQIYPVHWQQEEIIFNNAGLMLITEEKNI